MLRLCVLFETLSIFKYSQATTKEKTLNHTKLITEERHSSIDRTSRYLLILSEVSPISQIYSLLQLVVFSALDSGILHKEARLTPENGENGKTLSIPNNAGKKRALSPISGRVSEYFMRQGTKTRFSSLLIFKCDQNYWYLKSDSCQLFCNYERSEKFMQLLFSC